MRISEFLRASFVGALLFTPAMADEVEKVHDEALRVLRETLGQSSAAPEAPAARPTSTPLPADADAARTRAEREERFKAEARERMAERERLQAERRAQFEQFVKDRERLRQQQREYDVNAARQTGQISATDYNAVHSRALAALHQAQADPINSASTAPVSPAPEVSQTASSRNMEIVQEHKAAAAQPERLMAAAPSSALAPSQVDNSDVHAKALEVLRQTQSQGAEQTPAPTPSPELQKRLKEMQVELEQEQLHRTPGKPAPSTVPDSYIKDLERRAQESAGPGSSSSAPMTSVTAVPSSPSAAPLDNSTREIIQRQNNEISQRLSSSPAPAPAARPAPPATTAKSAKPAPPAPAAQPVVAAAPVVTHTTAPDAATVQYSKELEERARQILLEQTQNSSAAAVQPVANISPVPQAQPAAIAVVPATSVTAAPVSAPAASAEIHATAIPTLNETPAATGPKTKQQRIKEITDLYRADKMGPAEYHQKRAQILAEPQ